MSEDIERRLRAVEAALANLRSAGRPLVTDGTWTPVISGTTTGGTLTYSFQSGYYIRIGNMCYISCLVALSSVTAAPTGNLIVTGLPFTSRNVTNERHYLNMAFNNVDLSAGALQIVSRITNVTQIDFLEMFDNANSAFVSASIVVANIAFNISGWYEVA